MPKAEEFDVLASIGSTRFATSIEAGSHELMADEPEDKDGTDLGPTPIEMLMGSLASCIAITLRMYADRKEWPLDYVNVRVRPVRKKGDSGPLDGMEYALQLEGELDDEQRERLHDIAHKCPVHRTLEKGIEIKEVELSK